MAEMSVDAGAVGAEVEEFRNECSHYQRGCSFVSPCCGKVYPCRLCHDDKELSHQIDRHAVSEIICRKCSKRQPVSENCVECGIRFGNYFCSICRLYDDRDKGQFHCDKCGLCRVGGSDNFYHCDNCGLCISLAARDLHTCRQQMSRNNCPVCMEDIHSSRTAAHIPSCGHLLHMTCFRELMKNGLYQCPQCQTSLADMSSHWQAMDVEKESWQLPQHLQTFKVKVSCRDCHKESETLFHVVGFKCSECGSYNTVRCGNEEIPQDPAGGGVMAGVQRVSRAPQGDGDDETDSNSGDESDGGESSSEPDEDRGNDDPGSSGLHGDGHHDNGHPDREDRGHPHDNMDTDNPDGDAPGNQVRDNGEVDDDSYDGDESDSDEELSSSGCGDFFFDCVQQKSPLHHQRQRRRHSDQPIRSQTSDMPEWWESNNDEEDLTHSNSTFSPSHACHRGNTSSRKPHPPVQVMVEQLRVLEIWGSDYYTDSFTEVTSDSCEEGGCVAYPRQPPVLKKGPSINCQDNLPVSLRGASQSPPSSLTRLYSEAPSVMYPIQNGLNNQSTCAHTYPIHSGLKTSQTCSVRNGYSTTEVRTDSFCGRGSNTHAPSWVHKSSSEESWFTANEDLELGTLV